MRRGIVALSVAVLVASAAHAAPGDPRLIQGVLEWPAKLTAEPFVVIRTDDGRWYYTEIKNAKRLESGPLTSGGRVAILGTEDGHAPSAGQRARLETFRVLDLGVVPPPVVGTDHHERLRGQLGRPFEDSLDEAGITRSGMRRGRDQNGDTQSDDPSSHGLPPCRKSSQAKCHVRRG